MMKRILSMILCLCLFFPVLALAEFDLAPLKNDPSLIVMPQPNSVNTVYRPTSQPFIGQVDEAFEGELVVYVDYITLVNEGVTLLRVMASTVAYDTALNADQLRLTVGGKRYTLNVSHEESEYDGLYMEDFSACLTDASLPLLKAIAQQKKDAPLPVELLSLGDVVFSATVVIPGDDAARLYDQFIDLGGKKQSLKQFDDLWPCKIEKAK